MTQEAFAAELNTALTTIARYETNERIPRARTLAALGKLAEQADRPELAALFRHTLAVEFRDVTRKGYEAVIAAPYREAIGLREASTADLAKAKGLLVEMWHLSRVFEKTGLTLGAARKAGKEMRVYLREVAHLLFEQGELTLEGGGDQPRRPRVSE
jgi:transcriptional regulator with XRE-family HTH domain